MATTRKTTKSAEQDAPQADHLAELVGPDGRTWTPESRAEATDLRARGWRAVSADSANTPANAEQADDASSQGADAK